MDRPSAYPPQGSPDSHTTRPSQGQDTAPTQPPVADPAATFTIRVVTHPTARLTGGGYLAIDGDRAFIVVDPDLPESQRRWVVAHEMAHLQRGVPVDATSALPSWAPVTKREEGVIERHAARSLVNMDELRGLVADMVAGGEAVTARDVAGALDIAEPVAATALGMLQAHDAGGAGSHQTCR